MTPTTTIVAVPAHNEARRLGPLVAALGRQGVPVQLLVLLNNCDDGSRLTLEKALAQSQTVTGRIEETHLPPAFANAGVARRLALDAAWRWAAERGIPRKALALLTTDADAEPAVDWMRANLAALNAGADLVGGRIIANQSENALLPEAVKVRGQALGTYQERLTRIEAQLDPIVHDPWPRYHDTLGASLAIRGTMYARIGGAPVLACQEDLALAREVRLHGGRVRRAPDVVVAVSTRLEGRASGGMAETLRQWVADARASQPLMVEHPEHSVGRMQRRAHLRAFFARLDRTSAIDVSRLDAQMAEAYRLSRTADAFVERLCPVGETSDERVPLPVAAAALDTIEARIFDRLRLASQATPLEDSVPPAIAEASSAALDGVPRGAHPLAQEGLMS